MAGEDRPAVFIAGDPELLWALEHRSALSTFSALPPSVVSGQADWVLDKRRYYARCLKAGIPLPPTLIPDQDEIPLRAGWLIKPARGGVGGKRVTPLTKRALAAAAPDEIVLQKHIPGPAA